MYVERDNKEDTAGRSRGTEKKNSGKTGREKLGWEVHGSQEGRLQRRQRGHADTLVKSFNPAETLEGRCRPSRLIVIPCISNMTQNAGMNGTKYIPLARQTGRGNQ